MDDCGTEGENHYDWLFCCPFCRTEWTLDDIEEAYRKLDDTKDEGLVE